MINKYSFLKGLRKVGFNLIIIGIPILIEILPIQWMNLTLSGLLLLLVNYLKVRTK